MMTDVERGAEERGKASADFDLGNLQRQTYLNEGRREERSKIKADLLAIADKGELEDLRREVERYFLG